MIFRNELALHTGWSFEYIDSLPLNKYRELKYLQSIRPFGHHVESLQQGVIASLLFNQNVQKQSDLKQPEDIFPWLKDPKERLLEKDQFYQAKQMFIRMGVDPALIEERINQSKDQSDHDIQPSWPPEMAKT